MNIASQVTERCTLTPGELKTIQLLANGAQAKDAAFMLGISVYTVNNYTHLAKLKTKANSIGHLVAICIRKGWVT